jgi:hypothetical protein
MLKLRMFKILLLSEALLLAVVCLSYARTDHRDYKDQKKTECLECHKAAGVMPNHGFFFLKDHRFLASPANNNCADCHQQSFCTDCHKGGAIVPEARKSASGRGEAMPTTHRSDFISIHSVKAASDPQSCYRCHQPNYCADCHSKIPNKGSMKIKSHRAVGNTQRFEYTADHPAEARRNLQTCQGCHPDATVCTQCHNLKAPGGKTFRSR